MIVVVIFNVHASEAFTPISKPGMLMSATSILWSLSQGERPLGESCVLIDCWVLLKPSTALFRVVPPCHAHSTPPYTCEVIGVFRAMCLG